MGLRVSIVVPTFEERDNMAPLVAALERVLGTEGWELIVVDDDSPDDTAEVVKGIARSDPRVRCLHRIGRRGLSSAATEGFLAAAAPVIALMDGDLQHDEAILPRLVELIETGAADIAVGSRYVEGGSADGLSDASRVRLSRWGGALAGYVTGNRVKDPMSGYFAMRREAFNTIAPDLTGQGFKILADILMSAPDLKTAEVPFHFRERQAGESKFDPRAQLDYLLMLWEKLFGRYVPSRFLMFGIVGGLGVVVHLAVLWICLNLAGLGFAASQAIAALVAMTNNFLINNAITFHDRRLKGVELLRGLVVFYLVCSIGLVANVGVGSYLFAATYAWWAAAAAGAIVGAVWNYAAASRLAWRNGGQRRRRPAPA